MNHESNGKSRITWLDSEIRTRHSYLSFQQPDKIADAIRLISNIQLWKRLGVALGDTPQNLKNQLGLIVDRRNKIAHEADVDPTYPGSGARWPINEPLVNNAINFIESLCVKMRIVSYLILSLLYFAISAESVKSQNVSDASNKEKTVKLSGSEGKDEDAVSYADIVFIGKIVKIGSPGLEAPGQLSYHGVQVKVLKVLKGAVDRPILKVSLYVRLIPGKIEETAPLVGNSYIFCVQKQPGENIVLKILPATDQNITSIGTASQKPPAKPEA